MKGLAEKISDAKYVDGAECERTSKIFALHAVPSAPPSLVILDVGCGTGLNAATIRDKGHQVRGVDVSAVAIEKFQQKGFEGKQCDIVEEIPYPDGAFDLVFASEVIEHVVDTERFLSELHRVLRPGGKLILSTPNSAFWVYRVYGLMGKTLTEVQHPGHVRFFSKPGLIGLLRDAGFTSVRVAARHMYLAMPDPLGQFLAPLFEPFGLRREYRFKTGIYVWHFSRFAQQASGFWADTFVATAERPGPC